MSFVIVWRDADGAAVQAYAHEDKTPRVFDSPDAHEAQDVPSANAVKLTELLEAQDTFEHVRVDVQTARDILGWTV